MVISSRMPISFCASPCRRYSGATCAARERASRARPSRQLLRRTVTAVTWPCQFSPLPSALPMTARWRVSGARGRSALPWRGTHCSLGTRRRAPRRKGSTPATAPGTAGKTAGGTAARGRVSARRSGARGGSSRTVSVSGSRLTLLKRSKSSHTKRRMVVIAPRRPRRRSAAAAAANLDAGSGAAAHAPRRLPALSRPRLSCRKR